MVDYRAQPTDRRTAGTGSKHRRGDLPSRSRVNGCTERDQPVGGTILAACACVDAVEEGDGIVLRASALMDEAQGGHPRVGPRHPVQYRTVLLLPGEHVRITRDPAATPP